jgi:hypothetical protein
MGGIGSGSKKLLEKLLQIFTKNDILAVKQLEMSF